MTLTATETRRTGRPRALSHEQVVDVALELAREDGFDSVSMRNLGAALSVRPATLYAYFPGKDELVAAMVERLFAPVLDAGSGAEDWRQELAAGIRRYFRVLVDNPMLVNGAIRIRRRVPTVESLFDRWLELLEQGGQSGREALETLAALSSLALGAAANLAWFEAMAENTAVMAKGVSARGAEALRLVDRAVAEQAFERGLRKLLDL